jgi:hypothetical protein
MAPEVAVVARRLSEALPEVVPDLGLPGDHGIPMPVVAFSTWTGTPTPGTSIMIRITCAST